ncbi:MAG: hypothetical protein J5659_04760 [Clostridia bacterium]|nr:hypothetical protein [Clostridia bacterium]
MAKKDFSKVNTTPVYAAIEEATTEIGPMPETVRYKARRICTPEEALNAMENLHTTGLKGVKLPRINLAFTPSNYEFVQTMSRVRGETMTEFVNFIMSKAREEHAATFQQALAFRNAMDSKHEE